MHFRFTPMRSLRFLVIGALVGCEAVVNRSEGTPEHVSRLGCGNKGRCDPVAERHHPGQPFAFGCPSPGSGAMFVFSRFRQ